MTSSARQSGRVIDALGISAGRRRNRTLVGNDCLSLPSSVTRTSTRPANHLDELSNRLTPTDRLILDELAALRLACTKQLERLFFVGASPLSSARQARRTLAKLVQLDLVARLERRVGGVRSGSAGYIYSLATLGQRLLGVGAGGRGGQARRPWTPSAAFVSHRLAITELNVRLVEAERRDELELVEYLAEPRSWRRYGGPLGATGTLKPDAAVTVANGDYEYRWFVEVDRATQSPTVIARKCAAYRAYRASGREQDRFGFFPLVLFVVPTDRRRAAIEAVLDRQPEGEPFRVCVTDKAVEVIGGAA